jgi:hypothetical protein
MENSSEMYIHDGDEETATIMHWMENAKSPNLRAQLVISAFHYLSHDHGHEHDRVYLSYPRHDDPDQHGLREHGGEAVEGQQPT